MGLAREVPWWFKTVIRRLGQTSTIAIVVLILFLSIIVGAGVVAIIEVAAASGGPNNYFDALWYFVVTIMARSS